MAGRDASECIWLFLKNDASAAALRALLVAGAANVLESGDLTPEILTEAVSTRRAASETDKALAISIQDAGEDLTRVRNVHTAYIVVRVYDRGRGYRNLRTVRIELMRILRGFASNVESGSGRGVLNINYSSRTGHRWDRMFNVEYEAVTFTVRMMYQEED